MKISINWLKDFVDLNGISDEEIIKRLKERNEKLLNILEGKFKDDLKLSIENNYLEKFFYECRL